MYRNTANKVRGLVNKALVLDLARCEFIGRKENVLALGNSDPATFCTSLLRI
jgi:hypothetical protein